MAKEKLLILVDEHDVPVGKLEKTLVHKQGLLHRAFSIFIFNSKGELLLQQRATEKYHSGGLWTNTCCSHPEFGEDLKGAVDKRLVEEMGITAETEFAFSFTYKADLNNGLIEHEYDHVFIGISDDLPKPDKSEVREWKYWDADSLKKDILNHPEQYTEWFKICLNAVLHHEKTKSIFFDDSNA